MRIVIDLQGAQGGSRHRGIGRYSLALAHAMVRNRGDHEVIIALNGLFPDSIEPIRAAFDGLLPQGNIRVWHATGPVHPLGSANTWRRHTAELVREAFLASLLPDILHITSLFEGFGDDAIHSIGLKPTLMPTAVTLYDLIPLMQRENYLKPNSRYEAFYREKLGYLRRADLYLAISDSSRQEAIDHLGATPEKTVNIAAAADALFKPINVSEVAEHALRERFGLVHPFLMYSGATDERKNHLRLIKAFSLLSLSLRMNYQLAIVGDLPNEHRKKFEAYAELCGLNPTDVVITGRVTDGEMVQLYNLCELFVFPSWHEGFGLPALEAMSCGAPVIGANTSSLPEVIGRADALFDPFDEKAISQKIAEVLTNNHLRNDLVEHGLKHARNFSWDVSAKRAIAAFERLYAKQPHENLAVKGGKFNSTSISWLVAKIAKIGSPPLDEQIWLKTAQVIAQNHPESAEKQLLVDISELVHRDAKSGIQRVVRSVLAELLTNPPHGFRVEPVYATPDESGYRYARHFTQRFLSHPDDSGEDVPIEAFCGDIFLGLDLQHHAVLQQAAFYAHLRHVGVQVLFVVYDLLPVLLPKVFPDGMSSIHAQWLSTLAQTDGVLCISRAVADEMAEWLSVFGPARSRPFDIGWFHLGADVAGSFPTNGLPAEASKVLATISSRPTFLMVGTIEPRKGQRQTLAAFDQLWEQGVNVNLVMVGKHGWNVDLLVEKLRKHSERNRRLFWLEGISDEYLEKVYAASTCLIAASEGEGFGLPLIEAAQHKLPIIARDIPVFREVAGEHAYYFAGLEASALTSVVKDWLVLHKAGKAPQSDTMPWLTWAQSSQQLLDVVLHNKWMSRWKPDGGYRYCGSDARLNSQIGEQNGFSVQTAGVEGCLLHGPYLGLPAGRYQIRIYGQVNHSGTPPAYADITTQQGSEILHSDALVASSQLGLVAEMEVFLKTAVTDFEVRVWVAADSDLSISKLEILPESLFDKQVTPLSDDFSVDMCLQADPISSGDGYSPKLDSQPLQSARDISMDNHPTMKVIKPDDMRPAVPIVHGSNAPVSRNGKNKKSVLDKNH